MQKLQPEERAQLLRNVAQSLKHNQTELIVANNVDLEKAKDGSKLIKYFIFDNNKLITFFPFRTFGFFAF